MNAKQDLQTKYLSQKEGYIQEVKYIVFRLKTLKKYVEMGNMTSEQYQEEKKKSIQKINKIKEKINQIKSIIDSECSRLNS